MTDAVLLGAGLTKHAGFSENLNHEPERQSVRNVNHTFVCLLGK